MSLIRSFFKVASYVCDSRCDFISSVTISVEKKKETITESAGRQQKKKIGENCVLVMTLPPWTESNPFI